MRQLSKAEVLDLKELDQDREFILELWKLDPEQPRLTRRIANGKLFIMRAAAPDRLAIITPAGAGWAEGGASDVGEDGSIIVEDFMLKIFVE